MTDHTDIVKCLYDERDHEAQGDFYLRHIAAMTYEGLHAKSAIAAELAHRDMEITRLRAEAAEFERVRDECDAENARFSAEILSLRAEAEALRKALQVADRTFAENGLLACHAARQEIRAAIDATKGTT